MAAGTSPSCRKPSILIRSGWAHRDIANSLLDRNRIPTRTPGRPEQDAPAALGLINRSSAKRVQFRSLSRIEIESWLDASSYGLFASVQPVEFKRVLSNLVNNAVEAFGDGPGPVRVDLAARGGLVCVSVPDDGQGIPEETLRKLGKRGETFGKAAGSGLGLYHARACAEAWGGALEIAPRAPRGTIVRLNLPQAAAGLVPLGADARAGPHRGHPRR